LPVSKRTVDRYLRKWGFWIHKKWHDHSVDQAWGVACRLRRWEYFDQKSILGSVGRVFYVDQSHLMVSPTTNCNSWERDDCLYLRKVVCTDRINFLMVMSDFLGGGIVHEATLIFNKITELLPPHVASGRKMAESDPACDDESGDDMGATPDDDDVNSAREMAISLSGHDDILDFIASRCELGPTCAVESADFRDALNEELQFNDVTPYTDAELEAEFRARGHEQVELDEIGEGVVGWRGISLLRVDNDSVLDEEAAVAFWPLLEVDTGVIEVIASDRAAARSAQRISLQSKKVHTRRNSANMYAKPDIDALGALTLPHDNVICQRYIAQKKAKLSVPMRNTFTAALMAYWFEHSMLKMAEPGDVFIFDDASVNRSSAPSTRTKSSVKQSIKQMLAYLASKKMLTSGMEKWPKARLQAEIDRVYSEKTWLEQIAEKFDCHVLYLPFPHHKFQPLEELFGHVKRVVDEQFHHHRPSAEAIRQLKAATLDVPEKHVRAFLEHSRMYEHNFMRDEQFGMHGAHSQIFHSSSSTTTTVGTHSSTKRKRDWAAARDRKVEKRSA